MNIATRGMRNAFRNTTRTVSVVIILGLSIGLSLIMLIAHQAVEAKIKQTLSSIGNTVNIAPGGFVSGSAANNALTDSQLDKVAKLAHVASVSKLLTGHMQTKGTSNSPSGTGGAGPSGPGGDNTAKTSLKSPFKLNCDKGSCAGGGIAVAGGNGSAPKLPDDFSLPIPITGTSEPTEPASIGATTLDIKSGTAIDGSKDSNDAMISSEMAEKNNLKVGDTFTAYDTTLTVAAIFTSNTQSGNSTVIVSLPTEQRLADEKGLVSSGVATIDSLDNLDSATSAIKKSLGSSADVTSNVDQAKQALDPLNSVKTVSLYSLIGAVAAGAVIILLTMIMIVRERRREIGILKAIGGSNIRIMLQFMSEALTFTILGAIIGLAFGIIGGGPVTSTLVSNSSNAGSSSGPVGTFISHSFGNPALNNVKDIHAEVGWSIILYGLGAAVLIALIGSALASYTISKVRPAEVLRSE